MRVDNDVMAEEPHVVLDAAYLQRLEDLAAAASRSAPDVADRLLHEIERATVAAAVPANVVNIGSKVTFHDDSLDRERTVVLVLPGEADIAAGRISVLTPIGAALIGLTEGASIHWQTRDGERRRLTVGKVSPRD